MTADDHAAMLRMISGSWVTQVIGAAAGLSLAEHLKDGPRTADEIAERELSDPAATFRLMRACASIGLLTRTGEAFTSTSLLATLHGDEPMSLKSWALVNTEPGLWQSFGHTKDAVREGRSQSPRALGMSIFEHFAGHPEEGALFGAAMTNLSTPVILEVADVIDLDGVAEIVDVGGADGAFVLELMRRHPRVAGVVLELPHAVPGALAAAEKLGMTPRFRAEAGDFFTAVPPGDLFLVKYVLHNWDDENCVRILRNCRRAMRPGGRIAVVEIVMSEQDDSSVGPLMDIAMLTFLDAKERTLAEFDDLLDRAGLRRTALTSVQSPYCLIEAVAAR
ncbi:MAG TPA: methyltransferase [Actinoplanes sp.]|nr:methyltransferase [Actinoplanes sp.]